MATLPVLVPTDFTAASDTALQHAAFLANTRDLPVTLLHLVSDAEQRDAAQEQMRSQLARLELADLSINTLADHGEVTERIPALSTELGVRLVVMGTHGPQGFQRVFGSRVLNALDESKVPFLVVQERGPRDGYARIVVPIELSKESLQILQVASAAAGISNGEIHLFARDENDEFLQQRVDNNLRIAHSFLAEKGLECQVKHAVGTNSFDQELIDYADRIDADLIALVNEHEGFFQLFRNFEERILANPAHIPVLIVNPKSLSVTGSIFSAYSGGA